MILLHNFHATRQGCYEVKTEQVGSLFVVSTIKDGRVRAQFTRHTVEDAAFVADEAWAAVSSVVEREARQLPPLYEVRFDDGSILEDAYGDLDAAGERAASLGVRVTILRNGLPVATWDPIVGRGAI